MSSAKSAPTWQSSRLVGMSTSRGGLPPGRGYHYSGGGGEVLLPVVIGCSDSIVVDGGGGGAGTDSGRGGGDGGGKSRPFCISFVPGFVGTIV